MKTAIITGGNSGLGYHCAKAIAATGGWHVIIACRNQMTAAEAVSRLKALSGDLQIEAMELDLASLKSVRRFANDFAVRPLPPLGAIVCNAGIEIVSGRTYTEDGFETTFAVNHLGHFLLVNMLLRRLEAPARIVVVSSGTHNPDQFTGMPKANYQGTREAAMPKSEIDGAEGTSVAGRRAYTTSKLCNVMFTYELSRRLRTEGHCTEDKPITVNAFDPGLMPATGLARDFGGAAKFAWNYILPVLTLFVPGVNTASRSGTNLARLVVDPALEGVTAKYFVRRKQVPSSTESYNEHKAKELWEGSAELVGLRPTETILGCRDLGAA